MTAQRRLRAAGAVAIACTALLASSCAPSNSDEPLRVLAASSLTSALTEAGEAFAATPDGVAVETSFAGSQTLVTQLAEGVEADILATADTESMEQAAEQQLVGKSEIFATNTLVLITPSGNPAGITAPADIANEGVRLVLAAEEVPVGRYAREALAQLNIDSWLDNLASEEEDVKGVVGKISSGEGDAGIVYRTDVTGDVAAIDLGVPDIVATYPIALVANAGQPDAAQRFIDYLVSGEGAEILRGHGFGPPS